MPPAGEAGSGTNMIVLRLKNKFIEWPKEIIETERGVLVIAAEGQYLYDGAEVKEISAKYAAYLLARRLIKSLPSYH